MLPSATQPKWDGPKVWKNGKVRLGVNEEPTSLTLDALERAKYGPGSYAGPYTPVWAGALRDGRYAPLPPTHALPLEASALLPTPPPEPLARLLLAFRESHYRAGCTEVELGVKLESGRHLHNRVVRPAVARAGTVLIGGPRRPAGERGWAVRWANDSRGRGRGRGEEETPPPPPRLYFSLEPDRSDDREPFLCMEWTCGATTVLVLFKKWHQENKDALTLTQDESARLGIGMSEQEITAAHVLDCLKFKPVVFRIRDRSNLPPKTTQRPTTDAKEGLTLEA